MSLRFRPHAALVLVVGLTSACRSVPLDALVAAKPAAPAGAAVALFNGGDLSGFYTWLVDTRFQDPRQVFSVTNGWLRISGDGLGYLATRESFRDYELTIEFKWGRTNTHWGDRSSRARDSGIFLHATGPDGNSHDGGGAFMAAIECNIFEGATGDLLLIRGDDARGNLIAPRVTVTSDGRRDADGWPWWSPEGSPITLERWGRVNWRNKDANWRDITGFRGPRDVERPPGKWNQLVITCRDGTIRIVLNGQLTTEATLVWPREGKLLLQCEGSEIYFRRMLVRRIE